MPASVIGELPERLRAAQRTFERTGGLHATGPVHGRGRADARARGRRPAQRARQGHRQPHARRRDAARRLRRPRLGPRLVRARAEGRGGGHPGALRRGRALQPRRRCGAPPRPDARRASCATAASTCTPGPRGSHSRRHASTLRGAEPAVAFDAWLAALAERRLEGAAGRRARAARRRQRPRAGRAAVALRRQSAPSLRRDGRLRGRRGRDGERRRCAPGTYLRIDTGQPVDDRFDAVAQVEIARESARRAARRAGPRAPARTCAPRARTCSEGDALLPAGRLLSSYDIALAAVAGHAELSVTRRPAVSILPTGGELRAAGNARSRRARSPMPTARCCRRSRAGCGALCERLPAASRRRRADRRGRAGRRRPLRPRARDRGLLARARRPHGRPCSSATASSSCTASRCGRRIRSRSASWRGRR